MDQPPNFPPPQQGGYVPPQVGYAPPQPPKKSNTGPILMGCGAVLLVLLIGGGIMAYLGIRAASGAIQKVSEASQVAQNIAQAGQQAEQDAQTQQQTNPGASPDPAAAVNAGIGVLKSVVGGNKGHVETLTRQELKTYLPSSANGLAQSGSQSESNTVLGIQGTTASADYGTGTPSVKLEVTDAANMSGLAGIMDLAMGVGDSESDDGFHKTVQLGDVKVHEDYTNASKHAELIGVVGGRFVITADTDGLEIGDAEKAFQAVDIGKLESVASTTK